MKEAIFKDRVPKYPGRITLEPVEGKTNTYDMTRADEPTEEGTPLDKETFNSIIHSRLTGRYYQVSVSSSFRQNIQIEGESIPQYTNVLTVDGVPGQWTVGQRVLVQMPTFADYAIADNTFMGIPCNTILQSNKRYELRFNGSSFDAKGV